MNNEQQYNTPPPSNPALVFAARRRAMSKKEVNPYEGFTYGSLYILNVYRGNPANGVSGGSKLSPLYEIPDIGGHTLAWNYNADGKVPKDYHNTDYGQASLMEYDNNGTSSFTGRIGGVLAVKKLNTNTVKFIVATTYPLDDFFLYDRTAGKYIYRGKNVTANSQ